MRPEFLSVATCGRGQNKLFLEKSSLSLLIFFVHIGLKWAVVDPYD
jgi:hypothetical protein